MKRSKKINPFLPELPEHLDKSAFPLYRHLLPKRSYKMWMFLFCAGLVLFGVAGCCGFIGAMALARSLDDGKGVISAIVMFAVMSVVLLLLSGGAMLALYRSEMRRYAKRWALMNVLSVQEIIALQEEIARAKLWFGTFHLLEYYLYAPKQKLIIYYGDIAGWKQTLYSGVHLEITEQDGTLWQVHINDVRRFLQDRAEFMNTLERRVGRCGGTL